MLGIRPAEHGAQRGDALLLADDVGKALGAHLLAQGKVEADLAQLAHLVHLAQGFRGGGRRALPLPAHGPQEVQPHHDAHQELNEDDRNVHRLFSLQSAVYSARAGLSIYFAQRETEVCFWAFASKKTLVFIFSFEVVLRNPKTDHGPQSSALQIGAKQAILAATETYAF